MVVSLGPGKFYGSSLPRPRIYTDVKFNSDRVDPPTPVMDPFLSWAHEAHWSMGGLSFQRLRLQGRIEGNVDRLRKQKKKEAKLQASNSPKDKKHGFPSGVDRKIGNDKKRVWSDSPPPAPKMNKRRRFMDLFDEDSDEEVQEDEELVKNMGKKKKPVRKLVGDFEMVAKENDVMGVKTRSGGRGGGGSGGVNDVVMKVVEELSRENSTKKKLKSDGKKGSSPLNGARTSPRLAKQRS